jgi:phage/plasmid-associated DNA primase
MTARILKVQDSWFVYYDEGVLGPFRFYKEAYEAYQTECEREGQAPVRVRSYFGSTLSLKSKTGAKAKANMKVHK